MDKLAECINVYKEMLNKDYVLTLEDGTVLDFHFAKANFPHLIGLQKLTDIAEVRISQTNSATRIYRNIYAGNISYASIARSSHLHEIKERIEAFPLINTIFGKKIVVEFNPTLVENTLLNAEYILYRPHKDGFIHLTIGIGLHGHYPESYIYEPSNYYLSEQRFLDVVNFEVLNFEKRKQNRI